jgi:hypothetical protein
MVFSLMLCQGFELCFLDGPDAMANDCNATRNPKSGPRAHISERALKPVTLSSKNCATCSSAGFVGRS